MKILQHGAEAILYEQVFNDEKVLVKERVSKGYRIKQLDDKLRKERTTAEVNLLDKARRSGIKVPRVFDNEKFTIYMEKVNGYRLKDILNKMKDFQLNFVCKKIGESIAKLHSNSIVHGDLTTSNMILRGNEVFFLDFSLGKMSKRVEDQAVDLFLLYEALKSTHFSVLEKSWKTVIDSYKAYPNYNAVMKRLNQISKRRRYKTE